MAKSTRKWPLGGDPEIDGTDREILRLLQRDGRMTNTAMSKAVGLTATPMLQRLRKLEQRGVVTGYRAEVDRLALGLTTLAFVTVGMAEHKLEAHQAFVQAVQQFDQVVECHHIAGEEDYLLKVVTRDIQDYEDFLLHRLTRVPGIARVTTTFVMSSPKPASGLPIDEPEGEDTP